MPPKLHEGFSNVLIFFQRKPLRAAVLLHLLLAIIIFLPSFTSGKVFIGSSDNRTHHFANLMFNHQCFQNKEMGLWHPSIYGGSDFTASTHNFIHYPLNWILFLLPKNLFLIFLTIRIFLETWLIGVFGYLFFKEELEDSPWALFSSTVYQICGYTILGLTIYANLTVTLFVTIGAFLIFTMHKRSSWISFVYLSLCLLGLHLCFNIVYSIAGTLILIALFLYRFLTRLRKNSPSWIHPLTFACGVITGTFLSMIKLYPVLHRILFQGTRIGSVDLSAVTRGIYFSLSAFVPEVFDIYMGNSIAYLTKLTGKPLSSHVEAYTYFGVLPVLLVIWICLKGPKNRIKFWIGSLFVTSLWFLCVPPVNDIAHILSFPLLHVIIPKMMIPIPFCVLVGYAGKYLQENTLHFDRSVPRLMIAIIGFLVFGILSYITLTRENVLQVTRALMMISLMLIFILFYLHHRKSDRIRKGSLLLPFVSIGISLVGIIHARGNIFNIGILYLSWSLLGISFLWIALDIWRRPRFPKIIFFSGVLLAGLVVFLVEYYAPSVFLQYLGAYDTIPLIILGLWKFVLIVSFLIFLLDDKTAPFPKRKNLLSLFVVVVLLDLLAYNKAYIHIVVQKPFAKEEIAYPPADSVLKNIDAKNYRVNRPHVFLGLSADSQAANMFTRYDVRSYGGVDSDVPPRHYEFIRNFDPHLIQINGVSPVSRNDRFLDLLGCAYDVSPQQKRIIRSNALSRFMLFTNYEILDDDTQTLRRLRQDSFNPLHKILVDRPVHFPPNNNNLTLRNIAHDNPKTSVATLSLNTSYPSLLFFGDSYHAGWKASVNGKPAEILRANYKFMAIELPAGKKEIVFRFYPKNFSTGVMLTVTGMILFSFLTATFFAIGRKKEK